MLSENPLGQMTYPYAVSARLMNVHGVGEEASACEHAYVIYVKFTGFAFDRGRRPGLCFEREADP